MDILMPQLGETVAEGKITKWFKSAGDAVERGDNLFEIETDKVSMEVPATAAGVLMEVRVPAGETAPVGAVVAILASGEASATSPTAGLKVPRNVDRPAETGVPAASPGFDGAAQSAPRGNGQAGSRPVKPLAPLDPFHPIRTPERNYGPARVGGRTVTPLARRLAAEAGIDLARIAPSGPHGRIVARDVETAIAARTGDDGAAARPGGVSSDRVKALYEPGTYEEIALDGMRRTIVTRLVEAKQNVPHFYLSCEVVLDRLQAVREEANADAEPQDKLSVTDFVIKALARALQQTPAANAVWAQDRILRFKRCDIAVAVAVPGGLITPVIRNADAKSLFDLSAEMKRLAARAREHRLAPSDYQGGVSTVSNLGMYGIRDFAGIINPPQSTLLAVGAAERRPVETDDGGVRFETRMTVTLSCDHRVVDGALGAELLGRLKQLLEKPGALFR